MPGGSFGRAIESHGVCRRISSNQVVRAAVAITCTVEVHGERIRLGPPNGLQRQREAMMASLPDARIERAQECLPDAIVVDLDRGRVA